MPLDLFPSRCFDCAGLVGRMRSSGDGNQSTVAATGGAPRLRSLPIALMGERPSRSSSPQRARICAFELLCALGHRHPCEHEDSNVFCKRPRAYPESLNKSRATIGSQNVGGDARKPAFAGLKFEATATLMPAVLSRPGLGEEAGWIKGVFGRVVGWCCAHVLD